MRDQPEATVVGSRMSQVLTLALPFFGVIFIGFVSGKIARLPSSGLAWLDFYLIYVALPALFFDIISKTPVAELAAFGFIGAILASTFSTFLLTFAIGLAFSRGDVRISTFQDFDDFRLPTALTVTHAGAEFGQMTIERVRLAGK